MKNNIEKVAEQDRKKELTSIEQPKKKVNNFAVIGGIAFIALCVFFRT